jgi:molybdopterin-guanine dinucleotide biosynthesis protein A
VISNSKNINTITGFILAGGKSSRMGTDKGLIIFNEETIIQQVIAQLKPVVNNLVIVSNNTTYEKFGLEVIGDIIKDIGPAGGIQSALNHSETNYNFIVSCDMPFIKTNAIEFIIQQSFQSQITIPIFHQKAEPLFGVYTKECLPKWTELIQLGIIKLTDIASNFQLNKLNVDDNPLFSDVFFTNINTQNDFNDALKISKNGN